MGRKKHESTAAAKVAAAASLLGLAGTGALLWHGRRLKAAHSSLQDVVAQERAARNHLNALHKNAANSLNKSKKQADLLQDLETRIKTRSANLNALHVHQGQLNRVAANLQRAQANKQAAQAAIEAERAELARVRTDLDALKQAQASGTANAALAQAKLTALLQESKNTEAALRESQARATRNKANANKAQAELARLHEEVNKTTRNSTALSNSMRNRQANANRASTQAQVAKAELERLQAELTDLRGRKTQNSNAVQALARQVQDNQALVEATKAEAARLQADKARALADLQALETELQRSRGTEQGLQVKLASLQTKLTSLGQEEARVVASRQREMEALDDTRKEAARQAQAAAKAVADHGAAKADLQQVELAKEAAIAQRDAAVAQLQAETQLLKELSDKYGGMNALKNELKQATLRAVTPKTLEEFRSVLPLLVGSLGFTSRNISRYKAARDIGPDVRFRKTSLEEQLKVLLDMYHEKFGDPAGKTALAW
jgi:chromosome segregation ATPase